MILSFGILAEPVSKQLKNRKIKLSKYEFELLDKASECITFLYTRKFLTQKEVERAENRLTKHIEKLLYDRGVETR